MDASKTRSDIPTSNIGSLQPDEKKFEAAWHMVVEAYALKAEDVSQLRMQKNIGGLRKISDK